MSRTRDELPRWEGTAVPSLAVGSPTQPDESGLERSGAGVDLASRPSTERSTESVVEPSSERPDQPWPEPGLETDTLLLVAPAGSDGTLALDAALDSKTVDGVQEVADRHRSESDSIPTMLETGFDPSESDESIDGPEVRRSRRRQALFGLLVAGVTFGVALFLTGFLAGDGQAGDGDDGEGGDDVVTVGSTAPLLDPDEATDARPEIDRSGPLLTVEVDVDGAEAADTDGPPPTVESDASDASDADPIVGSTGEAMPGTDTTAADGSAQDDGATVGDQTAQPGADTGPGVDPTPSTTAPEVVRNPSDDGTAVRRAARVWSTDRNHRAIAAATGDRSWTVFENSTVVVRGEVRSDDVLGRVRSRVENVVGSVSVLADYEVVPDASMPVDPPLFMLAGVQFEDDGVTIDRNSIAMLQVAFALMQRYPGTDITIVHHRYPVGGDLVPAGTADVEARAIVDLLVGAGIEADRLSIESVTYNEEAAAAGDVDGVVDGRWIDFVVRGFLGGARADG